VRIRFDPLWYFVIAIVALIWAGFGCGHQPAVPGADDTVCAPVAGVAIRLRAGMALDCTEARALVAYAPEVRLPQNQWTVVFTPGWCGGSEAGLATTYPDRGLICISTGGRTQLARAIRHEFGHAWAASYGLRDELP